MPYVGMPTHAAFVYLIARMQRAARSKTLLIIDFGRLHLARVGEPAGAPLGWHQTYGRASNAAGGASE